MKKYYVIDTVYDRDIIPDDVYKEIRQLWVDYEFGNDWYYWEYNEYCRYEKIKEYVKSLNLEHNVLIHFWW